MCLERRRQPRIPVDHREHRAAEVPPDQTGNDLAPTRCTLFADQPHLYAAVVDCPLTLELPASREIIVVNDGSHDGTCGVLDALAGTSPLLTVVHAEENRGPADHHG